MKKLAGLCLGMGVGAALMYVFDPSTGNRRRSIMKDKIVHYRHRVREAARATGSDTAHRARGMWAGLLAYCAGDKDVSDDVLESRVRSRLGRSISHPSLLNIHVEQGGLRVTGHVPRRDRDRLHRALASVRGVRHVDDRDLIVDPDERVPYTEMELRGPRRHWAPAERLFAVVSGVTLGIVGAGLCVRGFANMRPRELRAGSDRRAPRMA